MVPMRTWPPSQKVISQSFVTRWRNPGLLSRDLDDDYVNMKILWNIASKTELIKADTEANVWERNHLAQLYEPPSFPWRSPHTLSVNLLALQPFHLASLKAMRIPQPEAAKWRSVSEIHEVSPGLVLICIAFFKKRKKRKKKVSYDSELMFWSCNIPFTNLDSQFILRDCFGVEPSGTQLSGSPHWSKGPTGARVSLQLLAPSVFPITLLPF